MTIPIFRTHRPAEILSKPWIAAVSLLVIASVPVPASARDNDHDRDDDDSRALIFSTVGDSRQDPVAPDSSTLPLYGQDSIWLQNTKALTRIMRGIHDQKSQFLFFNGDMIMGYGNAALPPKTGTISDILNSDLVQFYKQYAFWRGIAADFMEGGTYVVPVPGNHEVQWKAGGKKAVAVNEDAWRANMGDLIFDNRRLGNLFGDTAANPAVGDNRNALDGLKTDQSKLSFSFDYRGSHFVVINTDPTGADSHAPAHWLDADLDAAQGRGLKRFFVFGHKPAFTYWYGSVIPALPALPLPGKASGLDVDIPARDAFWDVIEKYGAIYFCGHEHIYNVSQPRGKAWQIMVGSGGSPFEAGPSAATVSPTDRYYAWATVAVHRENVVIQTFGFNAAYGPTHILNTIVVH